MALGLQLRGADSSEMVLRDDLQTGRFRYLVTAQNRGTWVDAWSKLVPPAAVAVITDADTLLLAVRGP